MSSKLEQKRRRVTRACDTCRQKKVKCDGKQPCIHCTVYSYNCTYDQPNIRNKKNSGIPTPSYPRTIISKNGSIISTDPNKNSQSLIMFQNVMDLMFPKLKINVLDNQPLNFNFEKFQKVLGTLQSRGSSVNLQDLTEGYFDTFGIVRNSPSTNNDSHSVTSDDMSIGREIKLDLPPKELALQLIYTCWDKACVLFRFYHRPSLLEEINLFYSLDPYQYTDRQQKFLPFLYSILAVGSLFSRSSTIAQIDNENLQDDGFRYFLEARKLIDITNVGDIISIQTIVMMIIYLQCSARLSTCYSYIGIGLRSALKEGLHRNLSVFQNQKKNLDPIEIDTRKRLFFTIYKMDIYINSLLGLPKSLNEDEFDQVLPEELDDENITREGYNHADQQDRLSSSACANHHTKLMFIMSHIVRELYPIKVKKDIKDTPQDHLTPNNMHLKVSKLEFELKKWLDQLPQYLKPSDPNYPLANDIPEKFVLANYYLHLAFLNCQIMLYRPFIHFISHGNDTRASDPRSLIRGRNCIKVARLVVKLANKMIDEKLLVGTYWFSMYTIFFSIACLIYYYHFVHNSYGGSEYNTQINYAGVLFDDDLNLEMIKKDIEIGKKVLDNLKGNSNASLRIYNILNQLFEQLNRKTAHTSKDITSLLDNNIATNVPKQQITNTILTFNSINNFENNSDNQTSLFEENFNNQLDDMRAQSKLPPNKGYYPYLLRQTQSQPAHLLSDVDLKGLDDQMMTSTSNPPNEPLMESGQQGPQGSQGPQDGIIGEGDVGSNEPYLPGVMDKLDTQIFGRILPNYMIEQQNEDLNFGDVNFNDLSELVDTSIGDSNLDYTGGNLFR